MPILHNRTNKVLKTIIKLQNEFSELRQTVEASTRCSARRTVFGANTFVQFDCERVKDQVPESQRENEINCGRVVAVDYCTEKVTVDCGSLVVDSGTGEEIFFEFVLDIQDLYYVPRDYESEVDDEPGFDRGYNSDA